MTSESDLTILLKSYFYDHFRGIQSMSSDSILNEHKRIKIRNFMICITLIIITWLLLKTFKIFKGYNSTTVNLLTLNGLNYIEVSIKPSLILKFSLTSERKMCPKSNLYSETYLNRTSMHGTNICVRNRHVFGLYRLNYLYINFSE